MTLDKAILAAIQNNVSKIQIGLPGIIESFQPQEMTANVRIPLKKKTIPDEKDLFLFCLVLESARTGPEIFISNLITNEETKFGFRFLHTIYRTQFEESNLLLQILFLIFKALVWSLVIKGKLIFLLPLLICRDL